MALIMGLILLAVFVKEKRLFLGLLGNFGGWGFGGQFLKPFTTVQKSTLPHPHSVYKKSFKFGVLF